MPADQPVSPPPPLLLTPAALHRLRNHLQVIVGLTYIAASRDQIKPRLAAINAELDAADHWPPAQP